MIELTTAMALLIYLGTTLAILLGLWVVSHYRQRKREFLPMEKKLNTCEFCHYAYLDVGLKDVTKCPRCNSYNKCH